MIDDSLYDYDGGGDDAAKKLIQGINPLTGLSYTDPLSKMAYDTNFQPRGIKALGKYDEGMIEGMNQEYLRGHNQSFGSQFMNGLMSRGASVLWKTGQGLGHVTGFTKDLALWATGNKGDDPLFKETFDNDIVNLFAELDERTMEALPVHTTATYNEGNLIDKFGTMSFWATDAMDGLAFLASAYIPGAAASKIGKTFQMSNKLLGAKLAGKLSGRGITGTRAFSTVYNTVSEAGFEGRDVKESILHELEALNPDMDTKEKEDKAALAAQRTFIANAIGLVAPNALMSTLMHGSSTAATKAMKNAIRKGTASRADILGKLNYWKEAGKGIVSEGLFEENFQNAVQEYETRAVKNHVIDHPLGQVLGEYGLHMADGLLGAAQNAPSLIATPLRAIGGFRPFQALETQAGTARDRAATAITLGSMIGGGMSIFGGIKQHAGKVATWKAQKDQWNAIKERGKILDNIFLANALSPMDTFGEKEVEITLDEPDKDGNPQTAKRLQRSYIDPESGEIAYSPEKIKALAAYQSRGKRIIDEASAAAIRGDKGWFDFNKNLALASMAWDMTVSGISVEDAQDYIDSVILDFSDTSGEQPVGLDLPTIDKEGLSETRSKVMDYMKALDKIDAQVADEQDFESEALHKTYKDSIKKLLFYSQIKQETISSLNPTSEKTQEDLNSILKYEQDMSSDIVRNKNKWKDLFMKEFAEARSLDIERIEIFKELEKDEKLGADKKMSNEESKAKAKKLKALTYRIQEINKIEGRHSIQSGADNTISTSSFPLLDAKRAVDPDNLALRDQVHFDLGMSKLLAHRINVASNEGKPFGDILNMALTAQEYISQEVIDALENSKDKWNDQLETQRKDRKELQNLVNVHNNIPYTGKGFTLDHKNLASNKYGIDLDSETVLQDLRDSISKYSTIINQASRDEITFNNLQNTTDKTVNKYKDLINTVQDEDRFDNFLRDTYFNTLIEPLQRIYDKATTGASRSNIVREAINEINTLSEAIENLEKIDSDLQEDFLKQLAELKAKLEEVLEELVVAEQSKIKNQEQLKGILGDKFKGMFGSEKILNIIKDELGAEAYTKFTDLLTMNDVNNDDNTSYEAFTALLLDFNNKASATAQKALSEALEEEKLGLITALKNIPGKGKPSSYDVASLNNSPLLVVSNLLVKVIGNSAIDSVPAFRRYMLDQDIIRFQNYLESTNYSDLSEEQATSVKQMLEAIYGLIAIYDAETIMDTELDTLEAFKREYQRNEGYTPSFQQAMAFRHMMRFFKTKNDYSDKSNAKSMPFVFYLEGIAGSGKTKLVSKIALDLYKAMSDTKDDNIFTFSHNDNSSRILSEALMPNKTPTTLSDFRKLKIADLDTLDIIVIDEIAAFKDAAVKEFFNLINDYNKSNPEKEIKLLTMGDPSQPSAEGKVKPQVKNASYYKIHSTIPLTITFRTNVGPISELADVYRFNTKLVDLQKTDTSLSIAEATKDNSEPVGVQAGTKDEIVSMVKRKTPNRKKLIVVNNQTSKDEYKRLVGDAADVFHYGEINGSEYNEVYVDLSITAPGINNKNFSMDYPFSFNQAMFGAITRANDYVMIANNAVDSRVMDTLQGSVESIEESELLKRNQEMYFDHVDKINQYLGALDPANRATSKNTTDDTDDSQPSANQEAMENSSIMDENVEDRDTTGQETGYTSPIVSEQSPEEDSTGAQDEDTQDPDLPEDLENIDGVHYLNFPVNSSILNKDGSKKVKAGDQYYILKTRANNKYKKNYVVVAKNADGEVYVIGVLGEQDLRPDTELGKVFPFKENKAFSKIPSYNTGQPQSFIELTDEHIVMQGRILETENMKLRYDLSRDEAEASENTLDRVLSDFAVRYIADNNSEDSLSWYKNGKIDYNELHKLGATVIIHNTNSSPNNPYSVAAAVKSTYGAFKPAAGLPYLRIEHPVTRNRLYISLQPRALSRRSSTVETLDKFYTLITKFEKDWGLEFGTKDWRDAVDTSVKQGFKGIIKEDGSTSIEAVLNPKEMLSTVMGLDFNQIEDNGTAEAFAKTMQDIVEILYKPKHTLNLFTKANAELESKKLASLGIVTKVVEDKTLKGEARRFQLKKQTGDTSFEEYLHVSLAVDGPAQRAFRSIAAANRKIEGKDVTVIRRNKLGNEIKIAKSLMASASSPEYLSWLKPRVKGGLKLVNKLAVSQGEKPFELNFSNRDYNVETMEMKARIMYQTYISLKAAYGIEWDLLEDLSPASISAQRDALVHEPIDKEIIKAILSFDDQGKHKATNSKTGEQYTLRNPLLINPVNTLGEKLNQQEAREKLDGLLTSFYSELKPTSIAIETNTSRGPVNMSDGNQDQAPPPMTFAPEEDLERIKNESRKYLTDIASQLTSADLIEESNKIIDEYDKELIPLSEARINLNALLDMEDDAAYFRAGKSGNPGKLITKKEAIIRLKRFLPGLSSKHYDFLSQLVDTATGKIDEAIYGSVVNKLISLKTFTKENKGRLVPDMVYDKVLRHEVMHFVYRHILNDEQREDLIVSSIKYDPTVANMTPAEFDEFLAEEFQTYEYIPYKGLYKHKWIRRIARWIGLLTDLGEDLESLFRAIEQGKFTQEQFNTYNLDTQADYRYALDVFGSIKNYNTATSWIKKTMNMLLSHKGYDYGNTGDKFILSREEAYNLLRGEELVGMTAETFRKRMNRTDSPALKQGYKEKSEVMHKLLTKRVGSKITVLDELLKTLYPKWNFRDYQKSEIEGDLGDESNVNMKDQIDDSLKTNPKNKVSDSIKDLLSFVLIPSTEKRASKTLDYHDAYSRMEDLSLLIDWYDMESLGRSLTNLSKSENAYNRAVLSTIKDLVNAAKYTTVPQNKKGVRTPDYQSIVAKYDSSMASSEYFYYMDKDYYEIDNDRIMPLGDFSTMTYEELELISRANPDRVIRVPLAETSAQSYERIMSEVMNFSDNFLKVSDYNLLFNRERSINMIAEIVSHFGSMQEAQLMIGKTENASMRYIRAKGQDSYTAITRDVEARITEIISYYEDQGKDRAAWVKSKEGLVNSLAKGSGKAVREFLKALNMESSVRKLTNDELAEIAPEVHAMLVAWKVELTDPSKGGETIEVKILDDNGVETEESEIIPIPVSTWIADQSNRMKKIVKLIRSAEKRLTQSSVLDGNNQKLYLYPNANYSYEVIKAIFRGGRDLTDKYKFLKTKFYQNNIFIKGTNKIYSEQVIHDSITNANTNSVLSFNRENIKNAITREFVLGFLGTLKKSASGAPRYTQFFYPPAERPRIPGLEVGVLTNDKIIKALEDINQQIKDRSSTPEGLFKNYRQDKKINASLTTYDELAERAYAFTKLVMQEKVILPQGLKSMIGKLSKDHFDLEYDTKFLERKGEQTLSLNVVPKKVKSLNYEGEYNLLIAQLFPIVKLAYMNNYVNSYSAMQLVMGDQAFYRDVEDVVKRLKGPTAIRQKGFVDEIFGMKEEFTVAVASDDIVRDEEETEDSDGKQWVRNFLKQFSLSEENVEEIAAMFPKDFESTDAQGFMTPKRWQNLNKGYGKAYNLGKVLKPVHFEIAAKDVIHQQFDSAEKAEAYVKEQNNPSYSVKGDKVMETVAYPIYLKYSSVVLTDELVAKSDALRNLRNAMEAHNNGQGIDEMIFASGVKVSKPKEQVLLNPDDPKMENVKFPPNSILKLSNRSFGLQLNPYSDPEKTVVTPTQLVYYANVMSENADRAEAIYKSMSYLMSKGLGKLKESLDGRGGSKFLNFTKRVLTGSTVDDRTYQLVDEGVSIQNPAVISKIITAMVSSLEKLSLKITYPGSKLVLQSAWGFDYNQISKDSSQKDLEGKAKSLRYVQVKDENGIKRLYAEVIMPSKGFTKAEIDQVRAGGDLYVTHGFGFRIPSTEIHSGVAFKVVDFYDTEFDTNVVIAPKEIVPLQGSDYDVDSLFVMRRSYATKDVLGTTLDVNDERWYDSTIDADTLFDTNLINKEELVDKDPQEVIDKYETLAAAIRKSNPKAYQKLRGIISDLRDLQDSYHKNVIVDTMIDMFTHEENINRMLSPISMVEMEDAITKLNLTHRVLADSIEGYDNTLKGGDLSDLLSRIDYFMSTQIGAVLTGVSANNAKALAYMNRSNLASIEDQGTLKDALRKIVETQREIKKVEKLLTTLDSPTRMATYTEKLKKYNKTINEKLQVIKDLDKTNNSTGTIKPARQMRISWKGVSKQLLSIVNVDLFDGKTLTWQRQDAFTNAAIDNVKEQLLPKLKVNTNTGNMFSIMIGLGLNFEIIGTMLNQPVMNILSSSEYRSKLRFKKGLKEIREALEEALGITDENELFEAPLNSELMEIDVDSLGSTINSNIFSIKKMIADMSSEELTAQYKLIKVLANMHKLGEDTSALAVFLGILSTIPTRISDLDALDNKLESIGKVMEVGDELIINTESAAGGFGFEISSLLTNLPHVKQAYLGYQYIKSKINEKLDIHSPEIRQYAEDLIKDGGLQRMITDSSSHNKAFVRNQISKYLLTDSIAEEDKDRITSASHVSKYSALSGHQAFSEQFIDTVMQLKAAENIRLANNPKATANRFLEDISVVSVGYLGARALKYSGGTNLDYAEILAIEADFKKLWRYVPVKGRKVIYIEPGDTDAEYKYQDQLGYIDNLGYSTLQRDFMNYAIINFGLAFGASNYSHVLPSDMLVDVGDKYDKSLANLKKNDKSKKILFDHIQISIASANTDKLFSPKSIRPKITGKTRNPLEGTTTNNYSGSIKLSKAYNNFNEVEGLHDDVYFDRLYELNSKDQKALTEDYLNYIGEASENATEISQEDLPTKFPKYISFGIGDKARLFVKVFDSNDVGLTSRTKKTTKRKVAYQAAGRNYSTALFHLAPNRDYSVSQVFDYRFPTVATAKIEGDTITLNQDMSEHVENKVPVQLRTLYDNLRMNTRLVSVTGVKGKKYTVKTIDKFTPEDPESCKTS